jgi:hypothetical protein
MEAQPFIPDDDYCAYCHAPAAGPCADCGALCCGDCVVVVMRMTTRRAVCRACAEYQRPLRTWKWVAALLALGAAITCIAYWL